MNKYLYIKFLFFFLLCLGMFVKVSGQSAQVINPNGGTTLTDGLKVQVNTDGKLAVYRDDRTQYYRGYLWSSTTNRTNGVTFLARFSRGGTYNSNQVTFTPCSTTPATQVGNTWITSISGYFTSNISSKRFYVTVDFTYVNPNKYFLVDYRVRAASDLPSAETIHLYLYHDTFILGDDASLGFQYKNSTGHMVGCYRTQRYGVNEADGYTAKANSSHGFKIGGAGFRSYASCRYGNSSPNSVNTDNTVLQNGVLLATGNDHELHVEFTCDNMTAGQTKIRRMLHGYGDYQTEFDAITVTDPTPPAGLSTPVTVNFSSGTFSENEGNSDHTATAMKINVSGGTLAQDQVCTFVVTGGNAVQNTDYTYVAGYTIPAGNYTTAQTLTLNNFTIKGNTTCQSDRTINVRLSTDNCNDLIVPGTISNTIYTILDDDTPTVNQPTSQTYCRGVLVPANTFVFSGSTIPGTTYTWTNNNTSIGLPASGTGNLPAFTTTNTTTAPITATITVTPKQGTCNGASKTFTITVNPTATVNAITNITACNGSTVSAVTFGSPTTGATFAWTNNNTAIGLAASGSGNLPSFTATNSTTTPVTATITVTPTYGSCPGTPRTFTITVNPTATVNAITNITACNGSTVSAVTFGSPTGGTTFAWSNTHPSIGLAASGSGNLPSFTATNSTTAPVTATITVTPTYGSCPGTPRTFTITVNPTATVNAITNITACNGSTVSSVPFTSPTVGTTFTWTNSNTAIGAGAGGSDNNLPSFTATNSTTAPISATITVTPTYDGCTGTPRTFTITVYPPVVAGNITGNPYVCTGMIPIPLQGVVSTGGSSAANIKYQWQSSTDGVTWNDITGATAKDYAPASPLIGDTYLRRVTSDDYCISIKHNSNTFLITVVATPPTLYWNPNASDNNWNNPDNWLDALNGTSLGMVPLACTDVFISNVQAAAKYPALDSRTVTDVYGDPVCKNITFAYGAELAYQHKLQYEKAFVRYNWGYYNTTPTGMPNNIYEGTQKLARDQWHILAAPLKSMATGDFSLAGHPYSWQRKFKTSSSGGSIVTGDFSEPFATNDIPLTDNYNAIAVKMAAYQNLTGYRQENLEGLKGILEFPYFENPVALPHYTAHHYDAIGEKSYFYYFDTKSLKLINSPLGMMKRAEEAYRFVYETLPADNIYEMQVQATGSSLEVMVGNPFLAGIDASAFATANTDSINTSQGYKVLSADGTTWEQKQFTNGNEIPAWQAFIITLVDETPTTLLFPLEASRTRMASAGTTRTADGTELNGNTLYMQVMKGGTKSGDQAELRFSNTSDGNAIRKMILPEGHATPEAFFMDPEKAIANLVQPLALGQNEIGIGVKTSDTQSRLALEFINIPAFTATTGASLVLVDKHLYARQDLSRNPVYPFTQRASGLDNQFVDKDRFVLQLNAGFNGTEELENGITISYSAGILKVTADENIDEVAVYDLQGRLVFAARGVNKQQFSQTVALQSNLYLAQVKTVSGKVKVKKIMGN